MKETMELFAILCVVGILAPGMPMGLLFVLLLAIVIWTVLSLIQKKELDGAGMAVAVAGTIALIYAVYTLFLHIDMREILEIDLLFV